MLFRMLFEPNPLPYLDDKRKMDAYCMSLFARLVDEKVAT